MSRSILVIGAALVLLASSATAQDSASMAQQRLAARLCSSDLSARCDISSLGGQDRVRTCVKEHLKDLSKPCQASLARLAAVAKACTADIKQYCADVKRGHGRIELCLESSLANLSEGCKDALAQAAAGTP